MSSCVSVEFSPWSVKTPILHNHSIYAIFGEGIVIYTTFRFLPLSKIEIHEGRFSVYTVFITKHLNLKE
jgi:hypothetical protein